MVWLLPSGTESCLPKYASPTGSSEFVAEPVGQLLRRL